MKFKAEVKAEPGGEFDGRVPPLHGGYEDSLSHFSDSGQSSSGLPMNKVDMSTNMMASFMQNMPPGGDQGFSDPGGQWQGDQQQPYPTSVTRVNKDGAGFSGTGPGGGAGWPSPGGAQGWNQGGQGQQGSGNNMALNQMMAAGSMNIPQGGDMVSENVLIFQGLKTCLFPKLLTLYELIEKFTFLKLT